MMSFTIRTALSIPSTVICSNTPWNACPPVPRFGHGSPLKLSLAPVSYTHLDVYKRQLYISFKNTYDKTIIYKKGDLKMTNLKLPEDSETYPEARKNAFLKMKELKESGRRIVGVFCTYTPVCLLYTSFYFFAASKLR